MKLLTVKEQKNKASLQNNGKLFLIPISKPSDCIDAVPMINHINQGLTGEVSMIIGKAIWKVSRGLDIQMSDDQISIIVEDILEKYRYESVEDILYCLKKGRQGSYGNNYAKFNMIVFSEWMNQHLEQKYIAKETKLTESKLLHQWTCRDEYNESVRIGEIVNKEIMAKKNQAKAKEKEFHEFKVHYESKQKNHAH